MSKASRILDSFPKKKFNESMILHEDGNEEDEQVCMKIIEHLNKMNLSQKKMVAGILESIEKNS